MIILDGKQTAEHIYKILGMEIAEWINDGNRAPHLAAVLVGDHAPSRAYVRTKIKSCEKVGMKSTLIQLDDSISQEDLLEQIRLLNDDDDIDGFIVQLPLPDHIDESIITQAIHPEKDVDGFHPENLGKMMLGLDTILPATPAGILELLANYDLDLEGKDCVVLGRSHIVGTPMSILLSRKAKLGNCTVTLAHSRTTDLLSYTSKADIIIAAIGQPQFLTGDMVKDGVIVVDVGINRIDAPDSEKGYALVGDVDYESVAPKASHITPVPGGVGPMTVASLLINTMKVAKRRSNFHS